MAGKYNEDGELALGSDVRLCNIVMQSHRILARDYSRQDAFPTLGGAWIRVEKVSLGENDALKALFHF